MKPHHDIHDLNVRQLSYPREWQCPTARRERGPRLVSLLLASFVSDPVDSKRSFLALASYNTVSELAVDVQKHI